MNGRLIRTAVVLAGTGLIAAGCGGGGGTVAVQTAPATEGAAQQPAATETPEIPLVAHPAEYVASTCDPSGAEVHLTAKAVEFVQDCLAAPAGTPFTIVFDHQDKNSIHNVAIYADPEQGPYLPVGDDFPALFRGDVVTGPAVVEYEVPALDPGTYYYRCDVHPLMNGTFIVA